MSRTRGTGWILGSLAAGALTAPQAHADSAELRAMRAQLEAMAKRIEELEAKQEVTEQTVSDTRSRAVLSTGKSPGSFILPGTNTEFSVSGYVKGDFIYDVGEGLGDLFVPENINTSGDDEEGNFRAHARQSRITIRTSTPTDLGALKTTVEGDFFGGGGNEAISNSNSFRLRHAYGEIGGLLAGQTWSNFMPIESYPNTVDFNGPAGVTFIRQAQLRYTHPVNENLSIAASLENSEFSGRNETGVAFGESITTGGIKAGFDKAPDFTIAARYTDDWGLLKVAGLGRLLTAPDGTVSGNSDEEFAWGINASGNAKLWDGGKVLGAFTYGDGLGRYLINGFGQDAVFDSTTGSLETIEAFGIMAGVEQQITDTFSVGLTYGRSHFDEGAVGSSLETVQTVHASMFYRPIPRLTFGGEVIWGSREDQNGADDDALRLQTSVQVNF
jgi:opacity protein-like surface antigen